MSRNRARKLVLEDYDIMTEWGKFWHFPMPSRDYLPYDGLGGLMIEDEDGTPLCAGYIFFTNSKTVWIGPLISNHEIRGTERRKKMMVNLIRSLCSYAKANGYKYCQTVVINDNLVNRYLESDFTKTRGGVHELVKLL